MSRTRFHSTSWYRVAEFKPQLAEQVSINRHRYRGAVWYVIDDRSSGRVHRFTPAAYLLIRLMDGRRTVGEIWGEATALMGSEAPGQEDVIQLLGQLHANDLLRGDIVPDSAELFIRYGKQAQSRWLSNLKNPLSIRIPLWDPDDFLKRTLPALRPVFGWAGLLLWIAVVSTGIVLAASHWGELNENWSDRIMAGQNLFIIWLAFPFVKILHEMGHGYAAKAQGGEVHEMGIMLLALMAVPYVDASSASGFRSKWKRALVGAAGMMAELFVASIAMVLWLQVEPGNFRAVLYDIMLIASVSTLIFNGNPLLRYDGYYILADLIEIPNLFQRANQYWQRLADRYLLGVKDQTPLEATPGERRWFLAYAPAALAYRFLIMFGIAVFLVNNYFIFGVLMAVWTAASMIVIPFAKGILYVFRDPKLRNSRRRAIAATMGLAVGIAGFMAWVPMPLRTQTEGVVWLPEQAEVRVGEAGFVRRVLVKSGAQVAAGGALVECEDPVLQAEIRVSQAKVDEIGARRAAEWVEDRVKAEITREEWEREKANLARARERVGKLTVRSRADGVFVLVKEDDLPGKFLKQGELVGFVVNGAADIVRVVVDQDDIDIVRRSTKNVTIRFASSLEKTWPAVLVREAPAAKAQLPSLALSTEGGGQTPMDPRDPEKSKALNSMFQFDLALPPDHEPVYPGIPTPYGSRVHVRFEHQPEPLAKQAWRRLRQLFLSRMNV